MGKTEKLDIKNANFGILFNTYIQNTMEKIILKSGGGDGEREIIFRDNVNFCKIWNFNFLLRKKIKIEKGY